MNPRECPGTGARQLFVLRWSVHHLLTLLGGDDQRTVFVAQLHDHLLDLVAVEHRRLPAGHRVGRGLVSEREDESSIRPRFADGDQFQGVGRHLVSLTALELSDVREDFERDISKLPNDVHIPMGELQSRLKELDPSKETIVYCRTGNRSGSVAEYLAQMGFKDVSNLAGGINLWAKQIDPAVRTY